MSNTDQYGPPAPHVVDTGGSAFPDVVAGRNGPLYIPGMTLRQYYIGQFISGPVANFCCSDDHELAASLAVLWADAAIKAERDSR